MGTAGSKKADPQYRRHQGRLVRPSTSASDCAQVRRVVTEVAQCCEDDRLYLGDAQGARVEDHNATRFSRDLRLSRPLQKGMSNA